MREINCYKFNVFDRIPWNSQMFIRILVFLLICSGGSLAYAAKRISGTIIDGDLNEPLIGATVAYWNNGKYVNGVSSGTDGTFSISVQSNTGELRFSMIGYAPQTIHFFDEVKEEHLIHKVYLRIGKTLQIRILNFI